MTTNFRCVCDTNVLISGTILPNSKPVGLLISLLASEGTFLFSQETFAEFEEVLSRGKFDRYISSEARNTVLMRYKEKGAFVTPTTRKKYSRDPDDDKFIDAAIEGRADYIISGDSDLLILKVTQGIQILTPADFLSKSSFS